MQIKKTKKTVTASNAQQTARNTADSGEGVNASKNYDAAQKHIKAAIDILAKCGKDDIVAKDNIANLSVVMFDLMGEDK